MGKMTNLTVTLQGDTVQKLGKIAELAHTDMNTVICVLLATEVVRSKPEEEKPKKNRKVKQKS
jgi:hypothetical protein